MPGPDRKSPEGNSLLTNQDRNNPTDTEFETEPYEPRRIDATRSPEQPGDNLDLRLALFEKTDHANGLRFVERFGGDVKYVPGIGFLVWDGHRYVVDRSGNTVRRRAHETNQIMDRELVALVVDGASRQAVEALRKWKLSSQSSARIDAMIREARPYLECKADELDTANFLFNAANYTIELHDPPEHWEPGADTPFITAREPRRDDFVTLRAKAPYDASATCPLWNAFLNKVQPAEEIRDYLQRLCGYAMTGSVEEQILAFLLGNGANGKSTFLETIAYVMGDYACTVPIASLMHDDRRRGSEASPDIARIRGRRLVRSSEPDIGSRLSESTVKQLTGGDRVIARSLHQDFVEFQPTFKLMVSANNRPSIRGQDEGIWRRIHLIPFDTMIPVEQRDRKLIDKLQDEAPGILNWIIKGYCAWRVNGLKVPPQVSEATREYRESEDPVGAFLASETIRGSNLSVRAKDLYQSYLRWCDENAETALSQNLFGRILTERGIRRVKSGITVYRGIELVLRPDDSADSRRSDDTEGDKI